MTSKLARIMQTVIRRQTTIVIPIQRLKDTKGNYDKLIKLFSEYSDITKLNGIEITLAS